MIYADMQFWRRRLGHSGKATWNRESVICCVASTWTLTSTSSARPKSSSRIPNRSVHYGWEFRVYLSLFRLLFNKPVFSCHRQQSSAVQQGCVQDVFIDRGWRVGFLGGAATTSPPARRSGERCELSRRGSGQRPYHPKVFHYFQHSGWPLLAL